MSKPLIGDQCIPFLARFTSQRLEFTLPAEAKDGMNITMKLRDPNSPNNATMYFDELSFKPDAVLVQVKQETPIGAIVGGAVGGVALLVGLGIICFLFMRKKKRAQKKKQQKPSNILASPTVVEPLAASSPLMHQPWSHPTTTFPNHHHQQQPSSEALMAQTPYSIHEPSVHSPPSIPSPQLEQRPSFPQPQRVPSASIGSGEPEPWSPTLPAYNTSEHHYNNNNNNVGNSLLFERPGSSVSSQQQQQISALDVFARANRYLIDDGLLEKLRQAGYSPVQKPDTLTLQEWLTHGVTKLEYQRLSDAYARSVSRTLSNVASEVTFFECRWQEQGQPGSSN
jgi:hypothetical protein